MKQDHSHQRGLFDPRNSNHVTIVGCGSVGSEVDHMLARMGVSRMTIIDGDDVRTHNVPVTFAFRPEDVGRYKVDVVRDRIRAETSASVRAIPRMYDGSEPFEAGAVIACVDTMKARACIWRQVAGNPIIGLFVDTRVHEHLVSVFAIRPGDPKQAAFYEKYLYPDRTTPRRTCGAHGVIYVTSIAASLAVRALTSFWQGGTPSRHERLLLGDHGTSLEVS